MCVCARMCVCVCACVRGLPNIISPHNRSVASSDYYFTPTFPQKILQLLFCPPAKLNFTCRRLQKQIDITIKMSTFFVTGCKIKIKTLKPSKNPFLWTKGSDVYVLLHIYVIICSCIYRYACLFCLMWTASFMKNIGWIDWVDSKKISSENECFQEWKTWMFVKNVAKCDFVTNFKKGVALECVCI